MSVSGCAAPSVEPQAERRPGPLPDGAARERIRTDLDTNLLVEAGAGSGKTTELVNRMLSLVRSGVAVEHVAAVTFTRKAAGELAQRFREALEREFRTALETEAGTARLLNRALRDVDRAFVGTIHAFCARLLREYPLAGGIDPAFSEVGAVAEERLSDEFWSRAIDELHERDAPILARLREAGLRLEQLADDAPRRGGRRGVARAPRAFRDLVANAEVTFPAPEVPPPEFEAVRERLLALMSRAEQLLPFGPLGEPDRLQKTLRRLVFLKNTTDWTRARDFLDALASVTPFGCDVTYVRWCPRSDREANAAVKQLSAEFVELVNGEGSHALDGWYAHRYVVLLEFLLPIVSDFSSHRRATGQLTFQDLLTIAAELLRSDRDARAELGRRYRHLLVDEFQDTDPLQAEVCFLLASDPSQGNDWRRVRPRPGALFVVGDPKQSIYRFRRADIDVYHAVRARFVECGAILELTANFRSGPALGGFVDTVFGGLLPVEATAEQAKFAPLHPLGLDAPHGGVFRYLLRPAGTSMASVAAADAPALASWIASRIEKGERSAGDFLVLTHRRAELRLYAQELERRNIPVAVTGAGLTLEFELQELEVLLQALADPGNEIWTVAALGGLFFGLDPQQLWDHKRSGGWFSFDRSEFDRSSPVDAALAQLGRWSELCRTLPIDSALERILAETGLLQLAVAGAEAESRAGSLVHVLEALAAASTAGAADIRSAIAVLDATIESGDVEAPLRPGRRDVVRVMNLHKAKGLEAPVVILAYPTGDWEWPLEKHIERGRDGRPIGWFHFFVRDGWKKVTTIARPLGWSAHEAVERAYQTAEDVRLLYVATTRACEELVVAECRDTMKSSPWRNLHEALEKHAVPLELLPVPPAAAPEPELTREAIDARVASVASARHDAAAPAYAFSTVTSLGEEEFAFHGTAGRGRAWGTVVHRAIAAMGRGREGSELRAYCRALLLDEERPRVPSGEPAELDELLSLLAAVRGSDAWRSITESGEARWELGVARLDAGGDGLPQLVTGVVDAAGIDERTDSWRIVDWKTDLPVEEGHSPREAHYRQQVEAYRDIVRALSGAEVEGRVVPVAAPAAGAPERAR